jgi:hypothetical protein
MKHTIERLVSVTFKNFLELPRFLNYALYIHLIDTFFLFPEPFSKNNYRIIERMADRKKQPTLAFFKGFTKTVTHRDSEVTVELPLEHATVETPEQCTICNKRFKNNQGLSVHMMCVHKDSLPTSKVDANRMTLNVDNSAAKDTPTISSVASSSNSDLNPYREIPETDDNDPPSESKSSRRGQDKRTQYSFRKKAEVIFEHESGATQDQVGNLDQPN